jgi:hypothetical protein
VRGVSKFALLEQTIESMVYELPFNLGGMILAGLLSLAGPEVL